MSKSLLYMRQEKDLQAEKTVSTNISDKQYHGQLKI